jgi:hypothetical protein
VPRFQGFYHSFTQKSRQWRFQRVLGQRCTPWPSAAPRAGSTYVRSARTSGVPWGSGWGTLCSKIGCKLGLSMPFGIRLRIHELKRSEGGLKISDPHFTFV